MNEIIEKIYATGKVTGRSGEVHTLNSAIDRREGEFLHSLIAGDETIKKTLEVGCAYGLSSLHICQALVGREGAAHTIIDPFQMTDWDGVGIGHLAQGGFSDYELIEERSEFALPRLLGERGEGAYDFVFVDGFHTFDHTLIDCFYATRLLRVGGILVVDDTSFPAIHRVVAFLRNYPCYKEIGAVTNKRSKPLKSAVAGLLSLPIGRKTWARKLNPGTYRKIFEIDRTEMVALKKIAADERPWDWHDDAF